MNTNFVSYQNLLPKPNYQYTTMSNPLNKIPYGSLTAEADMKAWSKMYLFDGVPIYVLRDESGDKYNISKYRNTSSVIIAICLNGEIFK